MSNNSMENVHHDLQNQTSENLNNGQLIDSELSKNKSNLSHNLDGIPTITDYIRLLKVLYTSTKNVDNPLNIIKKINSVYDIRDLGAGAAEDFRKISNVFSELLNRVVKVEDRIVEINGKESWIKALRNSYAHDNYYYYSLPNSDGLNDFPLEDLRANLTPAQQQKLDQYNKSKHWILWNFNRYSKNPVVFCCIISNEALWKVIKVFIYVCIEIIIKSKENESKNGAAKKKKNDKLAQH